MSVGADVLVVTASLRSAPGDVEDLEVAALAADIAAMAPALAVEVAVLDGHQARPAADALRAAGIAVTLGPADWGAWADARRLRAALVVAASSTLGSSAAATLRRSQPQAASVLLSAGRGGLGWRTLGPLAGRTASIERAGLDQQGTALADTIAATVASFDAAWCLEPADAAWLAGLHPELRTCVLPGPIPVRQADELAGRRGLVVLCDRPYDVASDDEAGALALLRQRVPALRQADAALRVSVVVDAASPELEEAAAMVDAVLVPAAHGARTLATSRLAVDERPSVWADASRRAAVACGTPIVLAGGTWPGGPPPDHAADRSVATAAGLLRDDRAWRAARDDQDRWAASAGDRRDVLAHALAELGVHAPGPAVAWAVPAPTPVWRATTVALRPDGWRGPDPAPASQLTDRDERYRLWAVTRGPTPATLSALTAALAGLRSRPDVVVAVPVDEGTTQLALDETLASLRSQILPPVAVVVVAAEAVAEETRASSTRTDGVPVVAVEPVAGPVTLDDALAVALEREPDRGWFAVVVPGDTLKPHALAQAARWIDAQADGVDVVYGDEDALDARGRLVELAAAPDWSPTTLLSWPLTGRSILARRQVLEGIGGPGPLEEVADPSERAELAAHDLALRLAERTERFVHVPEPWLTRGRPAPPAPAPVPPRWAAGLGPSTGTADPAGAARRRIVAAALRRRTGSGMADDGAAPGVVRPRFAIPGRPRVAVVVPTHDSPDLLRTCLVSLMERTTWPSLEVVVVDNRTTDPEALRLLAGMPGRVIRYPHPFDYARMMNLAAASVDADVLVTLNNDTEVRTPDWVQAMLEHAMRPEVGAVGARLMLDPWVAQHEGILLGTGGWAHNLRHEGLWWRGQMVRDTSAVTGACLMTRREVWDRVGGNDDRLRIAYNDMDLCLRIRQAGYEVVYTPHAELFHHESSTRGSFEHPAEAAIFERRWRVRDRVDPYYGPSYVQEWPFFRLEV